MNVSMFGKALLNATGLKAGYDGRLVLNGLSLSVQPGECIALIGPNGSGKSTLLRTLIGLLPLQAGSVSLEGIEISKEKVSRRVCRGMAYLEQADNVFNDLTVRENLELAAYSTQRRVEADSRIETLLTTLPRLASFSLRRAGLMSGGQRQVLALSMALSRLSRLVLLDEPIAGLAPPSARELLAFLLRMQNTEGFAVIVVEHRLQLVQPFVQRVIVMREGNIVDDTVDTARMLDMDWLAGLYGIENNDAPE